MQAHYRKNDLTSNGESLLLTVTDIAMLLRVGLTKANDLLRSGELPTIKIGSAVRVKRADLERWIDRKAQETQR